VSISPFTDSTLSPSLRIENSTQLSGRFELLTGIVDEKERQLRKIVTIPPDHYRFVRSISLTTRYGVTPTTAVLPASRIPLVPVPYSVAATLSLGLVVYGLVASVLTVTVAGLGLLATIATALWEIHG